MKRHEEEMSLEELRRELEEIEDTYDDLLNCEEEDWGTRDLDASYDLEAEASYIRSLIKRKEEQCQVPTL